MITHCVIGAGASGILLILLLLHSRQVYPNDIVLIDPYMDGGDLSRRWSPVLSNTPWSATLNSIRTYIPTAPLPDWSLQLPLDKPTPVGTISKLLRELLKPQLSSIQYIQASVTAANWSQDHWDIQTSLGTVIQARKVHFTTGAQPKQLSHPIPSIPLEVALDLNRLSTYITPGQTALVFGTAHSGTIVLKNLATLGCSKVYAAHTGISAFKWARDGEYDGVKLEAAAIADDIVHLRYPAIQLTPLDTVEQVLSETPIDWVVYAIGFKTILSFTVTVSGQPIQTDLYDGRTGRLTHAPNAWGFGIAYPSLAPDAIHWDVGISSFLEHIHRQLPHILS